MGAGDPLGSAGRPVRVRVGVVEDVERSASVWHWQLEGVTGLGVVDRHGYAGVVGVPEQPDMDPVAGAAVKLARRRPDLAWAFRVCGAEVCDLWMDHAVLLIVGFVNTTQRGRAFGHALWSRTAESQRRSLLHATIAPRAAPETERTRLVPEDTRSEERGDMRDVDPSLAVHRPHGDPRPAAVTFATTEHFTLQGARAATIAESTGRASMFLMAVSGGLVVAMGLIATASRVGTAFYAFGLILLPTLTFVGLVTFQRALQSGIEDLGYARRIDLLRGYYFDEAPELTSYLMSIPGPERLRCSDWGRGAGRHSEASLRWWR